MSRGSREEEVKGTDHRGRGREVEYGWRRRGR